MKAGMSMLKKRNFCVVVLACAAIMFAAGLTMNVFNASAETGGAGNDNWSVALVPNDSFSGFVLKGEQPVLQFSMAAWGPNWGWTGSPTSKDKAVDGELKAAGQFVFNKDAGNLIDIKLQARKSGDSTVTYNYQLTAEKDLNLTMIATVFSMAGQYTGQVVVTTPEGDKTLPIPLVRAPSTIESATKLNFQIKDVGDFVVNMKPGCKLHPENGGLRVMLAHDSFKKGDSAVSLEMVAPGKVSYLASKEDSEKLAKPLAGPEWFVFEPKNDNAPGVIGFNDWLDKPAGKHGMTKIAGDHFEFADGTKVKFWGTNLSYGGECCPNKENADKTAGRFAKYGVNCVRLHKFCGPGWEGIGDPKDGTKLTPDGLERLDYFTSKLTDSGVYYGFSHSFGYIVRPGNKDRLLAYAELEKKQGKSYALINFAEDIQDLMIEMVVGLLKHQNPYTKKTYAEDPALAYIELQNEDDIFFYTTGGAVNDFPTYKKDLVRRYSEWLKAKYKTQEDLAKAWGDALKGNEKLDDKNIDVQGNPWFFGTDGLAQQDNNPGARQRLLDNAAFFHDVQNKFYSKFVKAIRDAGYQGPLCGSPWQAPAMLPHYLNLKSDYLVGWIDRHNYTGGGNNGLLFTLLGQPGSGNLSTGLQQVVDRPFGVSEWIHVYPSLYSAEGPALFAVYGMGLQGWDLSYEFQSRASGGFHKIVGNFPFGVWEADVPSQIGQYPVLARMVARGDVKEGEIISTRRVSAQNLQDGKFSFSDKVEQTGDEKKFTGACPPAALAAGRCVLEFTDKSADSTFPDMEKYTKDKVITSTTGQLAWDYSGKGFFTVNTDGTKAVVGFAEGREQTLGKVKITSQCPYASIFLTASEKGTTLDNAKTAIVSAVARNCNSGFVCLSLDNRVLENGKEPIMLEPVKAKIAISGREIASVNVLDQDGNKTDKTLEVKDGAFQIDEAMEKTIYYEVVFK